MDLFAKVAKVLNEKDATNPVAPGLGVKWDIFQELSRDVLVFHAGVKGAHCRHELTSVSIYNKSGAELATIIEEIERRMRLSLLRELTE